MSPSELNWPMCLKKGFRVNPEKKCPKCQKKRHLHWNEQISKWECLMEEGPKRESKRIKKGLYAEG